VPAQQTLFGHEAPSFDALYSTLERVQLSDDVWVDYAPGWLSGHARLFDELERRTAWRTVQETVYDRTVEAPRLVASVPDDCPVHPVLDGARRTLSERYGTELERVSLALYRDGRDSVAWHGDRVARTMEATLVATVSVGAPRRFLLRARGGGKSVGFNLGSGDLIVMGGACQRTWQHSVPKVAHADARIAVIFRPRWDY
jgi:alkylated DNA repair dioxygenase AlkB